MLTNPITAKFQSLVEQHAAFTAEVEPFRNDFHAFLVKNREADLWLHNCVENYSEITPAEAYSLDLEATDKGVVFSCMADDGEGAQPMFFMIPLEYFDDPVAWEAAMLETINAAQGVMERVYDRLAPGVREELQMDVVLKNVGPDGMIHAILAEKGNDGLTIGSPNRTKLVTNSFVVDPTTEMVTYSTLM